MIIQLWHKSQWKVAPKRSPSKPYISLTSPVARITPERLCGSDMDTCLLPILATPGLDLFLVKRCGPPLRWSKYRAVVSTLCRGGRRKASALSLSTPTAPKGAYGERRFCRQRQGQNVPVVKIFATDVNAVSTALLKPLSW
jgi:hypothetical protein